MQFHGALTIQSLKQTILSLAAFLALGSAAPIVAYGGVAGRTAEVTLDGQGPGRTFEGLGAVSAGASSRLLIDYPEPQRSEILDFLFKPNYGASFQHLKVEIGGDINSTDGAEPSYARTREEFEHPRPDFFEHGYEWWLMREAKKRNPHIYLDVLQWGAPGWIGDKDFPDTRNPNTLLWKERQPLDHKRFYTQDNADFIAGFIEGAKKYHGIDIDFCGLWNETNDILTNGSWVNLLRTTLDNRGLSRTGIVYADLGNFWRSTSRQWDLLVGALRRDADLSRAVRAVGAHYPESQSTAAARECGKPLWASEDGAAARFAADDWIRAGGMAKMYNHNYIDGRMVKSNIWSLITSYYENLPYPYSGPMSAKTPWSGHYEVSRPVWAIAHTTQFAQPGWKYLDRACGLLKQGGSYVSLRSPGAGGDYSIIVETIDAQAPQTISFRITGGLATGPVHVWRSNRQSQFDRLDDVALANGAVNLVFEPGSIYSLTTTAGQHKGRTTIPPPADFALPYQDDFERDRPGRLPKYFSDYSGGFEVALRPGGGQCLRQTIARRGIEWDYSNQDPYTIIGSTQWRDYEVGCDAYVEKSGYVSLFGRIMTVPPGWDGWCPPPVSGPDGIPPPRGYYWLKVGADGRWKLKAYTKTLAAGTVSFAADRWHKLVLKFIGKKIVASIDGVEVKVIEDGTFSRGMAGVGSGWNHALFDNFAVRPIPGLQ
jgi:hypothetical protein